MKTLMALGLILVSTMAHAETELEKKCAAGDAQACVKDYQAHFVGKNGITKTENWWNGWSKQMESERWKAIQFMNGFAIFGHPDKDFVIGVSVKSVKKDIRLGQSLKYTAECLKYGGNVDMENQRGVKTNLVLYESVSCPEGL